VGPQRRVLQHKAGIFHRNQSSAAVGRWEPAVDLPLQLNFGSPYSSSLVVFFDFEHGPETRKVVKFCDAKK